MQTFLKFFYDILSQFFSGIMAILDGFISGIGKIFNFKRYIDIAKNYKGDFNVGEWVLFAIAVLLMVIIIGLIVLLIVFLIRKYIRFRKTVVEQESMLEEISELNNKVATLVQEKEEILAMKVSHLGLKPNESDTAEKPEGATGEEGEGEEEVDPNTSIRFAKLHDVDIQYADYKIPDYGNNFTLSVTINVESSLLIVPMYQQFGGIFNLPFFK